MSTIVGAALRRGLGLGASMETGIGAPSTAGMGDAAGSSMLSTGGAASVATAGGSSGAAGAASATGVTGALAGGVEDGLRRFLGGSAGSGSDSASASTIPSSVSRGSAATMASSLGPDAMRGRLAAFSLSRRARSSARAWPHASRSAAVAPASHAQLTVATFATSRANAMNENAARPISTSPRHANPTRNDPAVEKSDRASSPNSSPTSPPAASVPNAVLPGHPTCTSAAATTAMSRSPATRPGVAALSLPRTSGMPSRNSSSGSAHPTTPTSEARACANTSPTGPTQLASGYDPSASSRNTASVQTTSAATSRPRP